jgi:hypothetical protein
MATALSVLMVTTAVGCNPPDIDQSEVMSKVFGGKGVVADYDFGDSWDDVKKKHDDVFKVHDDDIKQLRRRVSDNAADNGYFIVFRLDKQNKIEGFDVSITGSKQNAVTVRKLLDDIIAKYDKSHGNGGCGPVGEGNSSSCSWPGSKDKGSVEASYLEMSDPIRGQIDLTLNPPKAADAKK